MQLSSVFVGTRLFSFTSVCRLFPSRGAQSNHEQVLPKSLLCAACRLSSSASVCPESGRHLPRRDYTPYPLPCAPFLRFSGCSADLRSHSEWFKPENKYPPPSEFNCSFPHCTCRRIGRRFPLFFASASLLRGDRAARRKQHSAHPSFVVFCCRMTIRSAASSQFGSRFSSC